MVPGEKSLGATSCPPKRTCRNKAILGSIPPALLPDGQEVEGLLVGSPFWEMLIHQGLEADVVGALQKMHEFVDHNVFEALRGLPGEVGI